MAQNIYNSGASLLGGLFGQQSTGNAPNSITSTSIYPIGQQMGISAGGMNTMHQVQPNVKLSELIIEYICMHGHAPVKYDAFTNKDFIRLPKDVLELNPLTGEYQITEYGVEIAKISAPKPQE